MAIEVSASITSRSGSYSSNGYESLTLLLRKSDRDGDVTIRVCPTDCDEPMQFDFDAAELLEAVQAVVDAATK